MRAISTTSHIFIERAPEQVFRFVTTPDNWVGTHPVTSAVRGETDKPAGAGAHWIEVIQANPQAQPFETEWWATIAAPPRLWIIETDQLGRPGLGCRIAYTFRAEGNGTRFHRDMSCLVSEQMQLEPTLEAALAEPAPHDLYLARIKDRLQPAK
jgi:uncharacterized protein YndB with AHSA1/START domain